MTEITKDHVEWAMIGRLRLMLEETPHPDFNVTQTYSHFSSILCWVMQRIRIKTSDIVTGDDKRAHDLFGKLAGSQIENDPWNIQVAPLPRIERIDRENFSIPAPQGFEAHTAERFLINLRDATAHGDARLVAPFNVGGNLLGFTFSCAEFEGRGKSREKIWRGEITLLEADMRRIGVQLARLYCDAIRHSEAHRHDGNFGQDAASIKEVAE